MPTDPTSQAQESQASADAPAFIDTPLKAAMRRAFDYPNVANIEAVVAAARAEGAREERERIAREQLPILQPTRLDLGL